MTIGQGSSNPDELRGHADLAGIADVIDVRHGHALIKFLKLVH